MSKSEGKIPRKDFFAWLREGAEPLQFVGETKSRTTFFKLPHGENAVYLFSATWPAGTGIRWNTPFEFCGMYFPEAQTLRLAEFDVARAVDALEAEETRSAEHWLRQISQRVNERVGQQIANDRNRLSIRKLSKPENLQRLQSFKAYGARRRAAEIFLKGDMPDTEYYSRYALQGFPDDRQEDALVLYFQNAESFLEEETQSYISANEEEILLTFLENDVLLEEYEALAQALGNEQACRTHEAPQHTGEMEFGMAMA